MIDPFSFANVTNCSTCSRVGAWPVGLFGEQNKIISDLEVFAKKNVRFMQTFRALNVPINPVLSSKTPA